MRLFKPQEHGFRFSNGQIKWSMPLPVAPFLLPGEQLCGGVVYAALDYFLSAMPIPTRTTPPPEGSQLQLYIYQRQVQAHWNTVWRFGQYFMAPHQLQDEMDIHIQDLKNTLQARGGPIPFCIVRSAGSGHHLLALECQTFGSQVTIKAYDPNRPGVVVTATGSRSTGLTLKSGTKSDFAKGFFVDSGYLRSTPPALQLADGNDEEAEWRWCIACNAMFYDGGGFHRCPVNVTHKAGGAKRYRLATGSQAGEGRWKCCGSCKSLFWGGHPSRGVCTNGTVGHDNDDATTYVMQINSTEAKRESGWRYCRACAVLYWPGPGGNNYCAAWRGPHDSGNIDNYTVEYE